MKTRKVDHPVTVTVRNPERKALFERVFGTARVPVTSPKPALAALPGFDGPQPVYLLNLEAVTDEERERMVEHISERFGVPAEEVRADLEAHGVPILATDCYVTINDPQRWV